MTNTGYEYNDTERCPKCNYVTWLKLSEYEKCPKCRHKLGD